MLGDAHPRARREQRGRGGDVEGGERAAARCRRCPPASRGVRHVEAAPSPRAAPAPRRPPRPTVSPFTRSAISSAATCAGVPSPRITTSNAAPIVSRLERFPASESPDRVRSLVSDAHCSLNRPDQTFGQRAFDAMSEITSASRRTRSTSSSDEDARAARGSSGSPHPRGRRGSTSGKADEADPVVRYWSRSSGCLSASDDVLRRAAARGAAATRPATPSPRRITHAERDVRRERRAPRPGTACSGSGATSMSEQRCACMSSPTRASRPSASSRGSLRARHRA